MAGEGLRVATSPGPGTHEAPILEIAASSRV